MKKVWSILALVVFSMGLFSCEVDSANADDNLYDNIQGTDDDETEVGEQGSGGN